MDRYVQDCHSPYTRRGQKGDLSFTLTKVVQDHGKGTAIKQKREVLAILLGVGLEALEGRKKRTY